MKYKTPHIKYLLLSLLTLGYYIPEWIKVTRENKRKRAQAAAAQVMAISALMVGRTQLSQIRATRGNLVEKKMAIANCVVNTMGAAIEAHKAYAPKDDETA